MERWEIQRQIRNLEYRKDELEAEISRLESKRGRVELEHSRKGRQISQVSSFYLRRRTNASVLQGGVNGVAVSKAIARFGNIYNTTEEGKITSKLRSAQAYLKKTCEKIDEQIESARSDISSINWQIYCYKKDLNDMESEVL